MFETSACGIYSTKVPILIIDIYTLDHLILGMLNVYSIQSGQKNMYNSHDEETNNQRLEELKTFLTNQHYPYKLVVDGIKKASELDREEILNPNPRNENTSYIHVT